MEQKLLRILDNSLSKAERRAVIAESLKDDKMKNDIAECKRLNSLFALSEQNIDEEEGERSYSSFMKRTAARKILHVSSIVAVCMLLLAVGGVGERCLSGTVNSAAEQQVPMLCVTVPAGHRAQAVLPDGTEVWLNAGSRLDYPSVFGDERKVSLDGEGLFSVAQDEKHPFLVSAGDVEVKALGTRFNVRNYEEKPLLVSLMEGSVAVYRPETEGACLILQPGETVMERNDGELEKIVLPDSPDYWIEGLLRFNNMTLGGIIKDLELFYDVEIVVDNPEILDYRFTGKFYQTDGIMEILRVLQKVYPFEVRRGKEHNIIYIGR